MDNNTTTTDAKIVMCFLVMCLKLDSQIEIIHAIIGLLNFNLGIFNLIRPQMHHDQRGLLSLTKVFTSSKAIPLCSIGYPSFIGK